LNFDRNSLKISRTLEFDEIWRILVTPYYQEKSISIKGGSEF
jgi:hypothetical protein